MIGSKNEIVLKTATDDDINFINDHMHSRKTVFSKNKPANTPDDFLGIFGGGDDIMEAVILEESPMDQSNNIEQVIAFPTSFSKDRGNTSHVNRIKLARGTHSPDKRVKTFYHMRSTSAVLEENHNKPIQETLEEEEMRRELEEHVTNRQRAYFHQSVMPSHKQIKGFRTFKAQIEHLNNA